MKHKRLTQEQRHSLVAKALAMSRQLGNSKKLSVYNVRLLQTEFGVSRSTIYHIWSRARMSASNPSIHAYVPYTKKCGRRRKYDYNKVLAAVREMRTKPKVSLSQMANAIGLPKETLRSILCRTDNFSTEWV